MAWWEIGQSTLTVFNDGASKLEELNRVGQSTHTHTIARYCTYTCGVCVCVCVCLSVCLGTGHSWKWAAIHVQPSLHAWTSGPGWMHAHTTHQRACIAYKTDLWPGNIVITRFLLIHSSGKVTCMPASHQELASMCSLHACCMHTHTNILPGTGYIHTHTYIHGKYSISH